MPYIYCKICNKVTSHYPIKSAVEIHMVVCLAKEFSYDIEKASMSGVTWHLCIPNWNSGLCLQSDEDEALYRIFTNRNLISPTDSFYEFYAWLKVFLRGAQT